MSAAGKARYGTRRRLLAGLACACALTAGGARAESLLVRLVRASGGEGGIAASLQDVAPALRNNLVFRSYTLAAQQQVALPASGSLSLGGYRVACSGPAGQLQIAVTRGAEKLLQTVASIRPGHPLILGGFPDGSGGQMILVFTVR